MFFYACSYSKYVGVENYISCRKSDFMAKDIICSLTYPDLVAVIHCLPLFIKGHYNNCSTIIHNKPGPMLKFLFTVFQTDGVYDGLPL